MWGQPGPSRRCPRWFGALGLLLLAPCSPALAYCRSRACDPTMEACPRDEHGCMTAGEELLWAGGEVEMWVAPEGSPLRHLSEADAERALAKAIEHWTSVTCPDGRAIDLSVVLQGDAALASGNAGTLNVLRFLDDSWPHPANATAQTLVRFDLVTGELLQADIEVNTALDLVAVDAQGAAEVDLEGTLTHELGHVLGLDHSDVPGATMQPQASGPETVALRSLEPDDIAGICAIYGASQRAHAAEPAPREASSGSTCSSAHGAAHARDPWLGLLGVVTLLRALRGAATRRPGSEPGAPRRRHNRARRTR